MATLASVDRYSMGSTTLNVFHLTGVGTSDSYSTGLPNILAAWMTVTSGVATAFSAVTWALSSTSSSGYLSFFGCANAGGGEIVKADVFVMSYS